MACESRTNILYEKDKLSAISEADGIDAVEASTLAWYFVSLQIAGEGTLCGPVKDGDVWVAEFRKPSLPMPVRIRIDVENGGMTAPGYRAISLSEATGH